MIPWRGFVTKMFPRVTEEKDNLIRREETGRHRDICRENFTVRSWECGCFYYDLLLTRLELLLFSVLYERTWKKVYRK